MCPQRRHYSLSSSEQARGQEKEGEPEGGEGSRAGSYFWTFLLFATVGGAGYYGWRQWQRHKDVVKLMTDPAVPAKLLPDLVQDPNHPRPYTLVVDLDKFLVCHLWDPKENRWRIAKRPGAELFLFYAAQFYEVVVFSSLQASEGDVIVKKLDPFGCISYALYRGATMQRDVKGTVVYEKDLGRLNRDPSKVVVLSHDPRAFAQADGNVLECDPWLGDANDQALEAAVDFLERLAFSRAKDVRPIVRLYAQGRFPHTFDAIQAEAYQQTHSKTQPNMLTSFFFPGKSKKDGESQSKSYWDKKHERMESRRREYAHAQDVMQKHLEAELAKERAYYQEHKMSLMDMVSGNAETKKSN
jgi:hypothetical protein